MATAELHLSVVQVRHAVIIESVAISLQIVRFELSRLEAQPRTILSLVLTA